MVRLNDLAEGSFWKLIDMKIDYKGDGSAMVRVSVSEKHRQVYGQVHGGVIASALDSAIAVLVNQQIGPDQGANTVELKVNYLRPATGSGLRAEAELIKLGRTLIVADARCYDEDQEKLVAYASGTYYRFDKKENN
ncbi:PaaI family thioesterase [Metallumcola ferriviriculae]|uniref:PaaI family thioesterase n=1 Tax=Metallumcola ferriviriculae TaxID=3039180 RepID=A0AAU0URP1_9FIRM|nr:PaaI family thioesterase [Desulfitibacteraceae bacterium MK1]